MPWGRDDALDIVEADLADPAVPAALVAGAGRLDALVIAHALDVDSTIEDTTVEAFDRHMAVNARASWLLVQAFARQLGSDGVVVGITSDHTAGNLPYGASKGAMDRIVLAAATEYAPRLRANVVNPGPTQTGWIDADLEPTLAGMSAGGRVGRPEDCARLVGWLCSDAGRWVNGQLLRSDGGFDL
jgi:3-oxoacyl-[acyl-carrier protein] reductase